jgi:hypothetical protein
MPSQPTPQLILTHKATTPYISPIPNKLIKHPY